MTEPMHLVFRGGPLDGQVKQGMLPEESNLWFRGDPKAFYRQTSEQVDTFHGPAVVLEYDGERPYVTE